MPLRLIHGEFRVLGASPDGDSVRFYPTDPTVWETARIGARANAHGGAQLRLDAIDALETHFTPPSSPHPWRQNPALGDGASTALLDLLGFAGVTRYADGIVTAATPPTRPGSILTRFADKYGRAVAFAFPDGRQPDGPDGGQVFLDPPGSLRRSTTGYFTTGGPTPPTTPSSTRPCGTPFRPRPPTRGLPDR